MELPEKGREHFFDWASAMFDALGPANARTERGLRAVGEMFQWLATEAGPGQVAPGSWSATIYQAVARGDVPGATAHELLSTYIAPALDTTIHSLAWAMHLFGQWTEIRENPDLIPGAYREILRHQTPVHRPLTPPPPACPRRSSAACHRGLTSPACSASGHPFLRSRPTTSPSKYPRSRARGSAA